MNDNMKDWGFVLLCVGLVMLVSYVFASCATKDLGMEQNKRCPSAPKAGHGPCPINGCPAIPADPRKKS